MSKRAARESPAEEVTRLGGALSESERSSRLLVDSIPGLVALLTADGQVQFVNRQILEYTGGTLEELKQWGTNDTVHPEDLPPVIEASHNRSRSGSPYEIVQRLRRSDGVYRWFQNNGFPIRDASGQIVRWCVLLTDVDERKRAEDALRRASAISSLLVDTIPALAWSAHPTASCRLLQSALSGLHRPLGGAGERIGAGRRTRPSRRSDAACRDAGSASWP